MIEAGLATPEQWWHLMSRQAGFFSFDPGTRQYCMIAVSAPWRGRAYLRQKAYRFRPYFSWLDTQSDDEMAAPNEISPARVTPAMISASRLTLPLP